MTKLSATSDRSPALAAFNNQLFIGWKGNDELNVMSSSDGINFGNRIVFNEFSLYGPALATFNNRLYIAWAGTDQFVLLNVMSSDDGENFGNKVTPREDSLYGPALAVFKNKLYIAWTGVDNLSLLNVMSSDDGENFGNKAILGENSIGTPALASVYDPQNNSEKLYIGWTGTDNPHHLNLMSSDDGVNFGDKVILTAKTLVFSGDATSHSGPALATEDYNGPTRPIIGGSSIFPLLRIAYTGDDQHLNINQALRPNNGLGNSFYNQTYTGSDTSIDGPALAEFGIQNTYIAWVGTNDSHNLNVKRLLDL